MSTKRLKILITVMVTILVFILGYFKWQAWEIEQVQPIVEASFEEEINEEIEQEETIIYTWEMTLSGLVEKVNTLVGNYDISRAIVNECTTQAFDDYKHCIESVVGVANAESTLFTRGMNPSNNGFWLMYKWKKRKFSSVEEAINVWVALYVKNWWGKRITWADWLKGKSAYCQSACKNWAKAYNTAVKKLELE